MPTTHRPMRQGTPPVSLASLPVGPSRFPESGATAMLAPTISVPLATELVAGRVQGTDKLCSWLRNRTSGGPPSYLTNVREPSHHGIEPCYLHLPATKQRVEVTLPVVSPTPGFQDLFAASAVPSIVLSILETSIQTSVLLLLL